jgi:predicted trehalose synthase
VRIHDWTELPETPSPTALVWLRVRYNGGASETYLTALSIRSADAATEALCRIRWDSAHAVLANALEDRETWRALLRIIASSSSIYGRKGSLQGVCMERFAEAGGASSERLQPSRISGGAIYSSAFFDHVFLLKLYSKLDPCVNSEAEMLRYLREDAGFNRVPLLAGRIEYVPFSGTPQTLAVAESAEENCQTGWDWMVEELTRFFEQCSGVAGGDPAALIESAGLSLEGVATLARRTAELHAALAAREAIHGSYDLKHVLRVKNDYMIIDFEGEAGEACEKESPQKDVDRMLQSLRDAAQTALSQYTNRRPDQAGRVAGCAEFWEAEAVRLFTRTYREHFRKT